jgi:signal transduction histidine kinase/DNA-binding response OmpR family regulator
MIPLFKSHIADNLEDLRDQLAGYLSWILIILSGLSLWLSTTFDPFPTRVAIALLGLLAAGLATRYVHKYSSRVSRYFLVGILLGSLIVSMLVFPAVWLPNLGLLLIFLCAILITGGAYLSTGLVGGVAWLLVFHGLRAYDLYPLLFLLFCGLIVALLVINTLYTSLEWTHSMNLRANELLEEARQQRAELSEALKSLNLVYEYQKKIQAELIWARKRADEARRSKEQFAANISHELRTPLNLILGFTEMMYVSPQIYGDVNWTQPLRQDIYQTYRNSRHLLGLIDDILDLSRYEIMGFSLNLESVPIGPLIQDTCEIARDLFRGRDVEFQIDIQENLPTVEIDQTRIRQVLLNLLNNASRFTQQGTVRLNACLQEQQLLVQVSDTGPGISPEKLAMVFNEFYQVDSSIRREHGGAGLGLAICKQFVEAHNGNIWVESVEGQGSTFSLTIPLRPVAQLEEPYLPKSAVNGKTAGIRSRILIVDPDPSLVALVRHLLQDFDVIQVKNLGLLPEAVLLHRPNAVILNNPSGESLVDGRTLANVPVPVVECALPTRFWLAQQLQIAAYLTKPVTSQELVQEVKRLGKIQRALLVDDDRGFLQFLERSLQSLSNHFEIMRAYSSQEALEAIPEFSPDLILYGLSMAGDEGPDPLIAIRDRAGCPVILLADSLHSSDPVSANDSHRISIWQKNGFQSTEIMRIVNLLMRTVKPRYDPD